MNLIDGVVVRIKAPPMNKFSKWFVQVVVDAYGRESDTELMYNTQEAAEKVKVGDKVLI